MDHFDELLRERARREPFPLPEDYAQRVQDTCAALEDRPPAQRRSFRHWGGWLAAALALFVAVPNISPAAAAAMAEIPVLGSLVEIVTFHRYAYDDGHSSADVTVPELSGGQAAQAVSDEVQAYTDRLLEEFQAQQETVGEGYQGLYVTSSVVTDTPEWFTLRIDATQTQASGYDFSRFYHIDKTTDETVVLADLFQEDADYAQVLSGEVQAQMASQTAADPAVMYFPEQLAIPADQSFYWNETGDLVLVFDEYAVAPGSMGMPEFIIPREVYAPLLRTP